MPDQLADDPRYQRLCELLATTADLGAAAALLQWDQRVNLPGAGVADRARQLATVVRLRHELFTSDEVGDLLEDLGPDGGSLEDGPSILRVAWRKYEKALKLPPEFVARRSVAVSQAQASWERARATASFATFADDLARVVALVVEEAERLGYEGERYDALLDRYEPETPTTMVRSLFARLHADLERLVVQARDDVAADPWQRQPYNAGRQREFGHYLLDSIGYDLERGRVDLSAHPFCVDLGPGDVRLTTRVELRGLGGLWATLHEGGHGVHAQGIPTRYYRTPIWGSPGLGISESQSRLFENVVGRSRPFWAHHLPALRDLFPEALSGVDVEPFYRAINRVRPSAIRVSADELTYHLHIMLRFELEVALVNEELAVKELPDAWNAGMEMYLGLTPDDDAQGVLQDIHWAGGAFGYFPTYTLGSLLACQWWELATEADPAVEAELARGRCDALRAWLGEELYAYGAKLTPPRLVERVTGGPLSVEPFLKYAGLKYAS